MTTTRSAPSSSGSSGRSTARAAATTAGDRRAARRAGAPPSSAARTSVEGELGGGRTSVEVPGHDGSSLRAAKRTAVPTYAGPVIDRGAGHPEPACEARVYRVPLRTRFRGIDVRDGVLVRGPAGWGEFSPFWDYDVAESRRWWAAAEEAAVEGWPAPVRDAVPVNVTVPAVGPGAGARDRRRVGLPHREGEGRRAGPDARPTTSPGWRRCATRSAPPARSGSTRTRPGTSTPRCARMRELGRVGLEYVEQPCADAGGPGRAAPPDRRAGRRRRGGAPLRRPAAGRPARGLRRRRPQGAAAGRGARGAAGGRGARPAVRRLLGAGDLGRHRRRRRAGRGAARAALRLRAGHRRAVHRRRHRAPRCCRSTASCRCAASSPTGSTRSPRTRTPTPGGARGWRRWPPREPLDRAGPGAGRRAGARRRHRRRPGARLALGAGRARAGRGRARRPAAAARAHRRADGGASWRSAWRRPRAGRCRCSPPRARRPRTCTPRCWRPTRAGCRCSRSPPTGRRSCARPAPTRPSTRPGSTAARCGGPPTWACPRPAARRRRTATGARWSPGRCWSRAARSPGTPARCTSTWRCASRCCPTTTRPAARRTWPGRPDGAPWTSAAPAPRTERAAAAGPPRTLVVVGDAPPALGRGRRARRQLRLAGGGRAQQRGVGRRRGLRGGALLLGVPALAGRAPARAGARRRPAHARPAASPRCWPTPPCGSRSPRRRRGGPTPGAGRRRSLGVPADRPGEPAAPGWSGAWRDAAARVGAAVDAAARRGARTDGRPAGPRRRRRAARRARCWCSARPRRSATSSGWPCRGPT